MPARRKVLLVSLGHPDLVQGGSPIVCQELFAELRTRTDLSCQMLAAVDPASGASHQPGAGVVPYDGSDDVYLLHQKDHDPWLCRNNDPDLIESFITLLRALNPDVVHFHHFMALGADLIGVTRKELPASRILLTFHEFAAICAADGHMVRRQDRSLCDRASPARCQQCFPDRPRDDFIMRTAWLRHHLGQVDHFTCPSHFMIDRFVDWGIPRERITAVTNGQQSRALHPLLPRLPLNGAVSERNRFGFFGLLHDNKGVQILLRAVTMLREAGFTDFQIDINGDGIQHASAAVRQEIETFRAAEEARPPAERNVIFNGPYRHDQLRGRMARIDWTIVPSIWCEIFGLVISEAWMFGRPVICSNVGGMVERVTHEVNGLHFEMGDPMLLAGTIRRACTEEGLWDRLHAAIPVPPGRAEMADQFLALYQA
jgi:glycosyltransferase involved in cell wall biosynthesis